MGKYFIGVDLGGTNIAAGVVGGDHKVISRDKRKTKAAGGEERVIERITKTVLGAIEEAKLKKADIGGVGIGAPGAIDIDKGVVINAVNLRWNDFPLAEVLKKELDLPVTVDNDVNVGTWGEAVAGAGRKYKDMLGIFVGTGIGGGLVIGGKLYHGHHNTAGEIGHTVLLGDAPKGRRTLENVASRTATTTLLKSLILSNHESELSAITEGDLDNIRSSALKRAFESEDPLTMEILRQTAEYVGIAIANTLTLLSLPCAVVGGGVTEALGENWLKWVRKSFKTHVFPPILADCPVLASELGDDAGVVGAADLARKRLG